MTAAKKLYRYKFVVASSLCRSQTTAYNKPQYHLDLKQSTW